ncbi:hypothetical protein PR202_ga17636 [Eleusine coracana subsp. coracana]|uniref:GST N-terminal domain-containing protein n=1 Tax=Eleusine coracana subsp. coracana TaxID=191504 RepID=A0AAV5CPV7_ELECO|nr:hypothetical protein PR202_ga17389 [Eleusine coracana subsp. coracana]GJN00453.1 hypothetical protein PR202_ga17636 [Eleusine coracana subsp. coracana]
MAVLLSSTASATATTAGPSSALLTTTFRSGRGRLMPRVSPPRRAFAARASAEPLEVCAKESLTVPGRLGDCERSCPFSIPFLLCAHKCKDGESAMLFQINPEGKVPIVKLEDKWIADSDVITQTIEEKYPEPPLATAPEKASIGSKIFSTFIGFLKSKDPSDGTEQALLDELTSFDSYLKDNGPFICGGTISAADLSLGPKLYHMEIALGHYKNWSVPDSLPHVKAYMKNMNMELG